MWTDAAIETLRQMALEGKSASSIAVALGAPSRNAVIGKANRIGVKLTGNIHCWRRERLGQARSGRGDPRSLAPTLLWKRVAVPAVPRERKPAWAFAQAQVGEMLKVGLEEIGESACRWPIGDPTSEEFAYCGIQNAKGRSYCAGHCRMAYKPPSSRVWDGQRYMALEIDGGRLKPQLAGFLIQRDGWGRAPARAEAFRAGAISLSAQLPSLAASACLN